MKEFRNFVSAALYMWTTHTPDMDYNFQRKCCQKELGHSSLPEQCDPLCIVQNIETCSAHPASAHQLFRCVDMATCAALFPLARVNRAILANVDAVALRQVGLGHACRVGPHEVRVVDGEEGRCVGGFGCVVKAQRHVGHNAGGSLNGTAAHHSTCAHRQHDIITIMTEQSTV